jgi:heme-degrading monooxygenase HmoA
MVRLRPMDSAFPIEKQLAVNASNVVLISLFSVDAADCDALLEAWEEDASWMKKQPGFISTQLHRALGESFMFMNYAVWESVDSFRKAFSHPEFKSRMANYPASAVASPHLFQKLAIANICVA